MLPPISAVLRRLRSPFLQIAVLGALTWLAYLHLAAAYPFQAFVAKYPLTDFGRANDWSQAALLDFLVAILGPLALGVLGWRVACHHPRERRLLWLICAFAALFAITLLAMYPITATDVFEYVFHSRILVHYGKNPLVVPPNAFKGDPFLKTVNWAPHPSPYGPLWVLLTVPGSALAGDDLLLNLFWMKGLTVVFYLGCVLVIAAILQRKNPDYQSAGTLLFAWNPLILFEALGNGHNGIIMMFFALFAIYLLMRRDWLWVLPALVASVLVKYITAILLLPFLIYCLRAQNGKRARLLFLLKTCGSAGALALLLALPFFEVPWGLLEEANFYSLLAAPSLAYNFLKGIHGDKIAKVLTIMTSVAAYLLLYAISLRDLARDEGPRRLLVLSVWLITTYLGIACMHFQPWFAVWPIALGIWINHALVRRVLLVFTASALLSYAANFFWIWNYRTWQPLQTNAIFVAVVFAPPLLVGILGLPWIPRVSLKRFALPKIQRA